ncbi:MAG: RsmE family RNA methyltransferase [Candidatus Comchoanobacterales bacterium]
MNILINLSMSSILYFKIKFSYINGMKRIYTTHLPQPGTWIYEGPFEHYIKNVLRCHEGDLFVFFDGSSNVNATLIKLGKQQIIFDVGVAKTSQIHNTGIGLALGIIKPSNMDWVIQKATELGCDALYPLITERTQGHFYAKAKQTHWHKTMIQACMQSGRDMLMDIHTPQPLHKWLSHQDLPIVYFDPRGTQHALALQGQHQLLIGPEGGFSAEEDRLILEHHAKQVRFGQHILRSETAAVAGIAYLLTQLGTTS